MGIIKNIKDGWGNYLRFFYDSKTLDPKILEEGKRRAEICKDCPSLEESKVYSIIETVLPGGDKKEHITNLLPNSDSEKIRGYKCKECGCGFPAMVFSPGKKCKINKW